MTAAQYATEYTAVCPHGMVVAWRMSVRGDTPGCPTWHGDNPRPYGYARLIDLLRGIL